MVGYHHSLNANHQDVSSLVEDTLIRRVGPPQSSLEREHPVGGSNRGPQTQICIKLLLTRRAGYSTQAPCMQSKAMLCLPIAPLPIRHAQAV